MAIYYPGSTDQLDASVTPFLQEPPSSASFNELSLPPGGNMMMYINQGAPSSSYLEFMSEHSLSQHDCVDMATAGGGGNGLLNFPTSGVVTMPNNAASNPYNIDEGSRKIPRMGLNMLNTDQNVHSQGLSLSLSTDIAGSSHFYSGSGLESFSQLPMAAEGATSSNYLQMPGELSGDYGHIFKNDAVYSPQLSMGLKQNQYDPNMYTLFHTKTICDSKYLKAAQQLLDEVVSVQDALKKPEIDKNQKLHQTSVGTGTGTGTGTGRDRFSENATSDKNEESSNELSVTARQELQNKKSKLMSMLEEVDRRFSHYYHQMHVMVSSFDAVAGPGAAKPYTKLALQTISRHFRCLRDAIVGQIQATRRSLGEQDTSANLLGGGIPRLRYVDQQIRQQRGLHQFGVSRHSWRPQRGLPESSVTILRAWLFEHFLHPYPKESEKVMLARQTGLTRGQVANWFINARVRLWKPMVEEMYKEEFGESETVSMSSPDPSFNLPKGGRLTPWASIDAPDEDLQQNLTVPHHHKFSDPNSKPDFSPSPLADFFQSRSPGDNDLSFGLMKFEGGERRPDAVDHNELISHDAGGSSSAQDSQVSLGLGVIGTRP